MNIGQIKIKLNENRPDIPVDDRVPLSWALSGMADALEFFTAVKHSEADEWEAKLKTLFDSIIGKTVATPTVPEKVVDPRVSVIEGSPTGHHPQNQMRAEDWHGWC